MNTPDFIRRPLFWLCIAAAPAALGQATTNIAFNNVNMVIPDNNWNGAQNSQTITDVPGSIADIEVSVLIAGTGLGAFNADLYMELVNTAGGFAVLLNRVGVSASNPFGYGDNGFDVTFSNAATNDIHFYANLSYDLNPSGQLTGTWQPDGENISPLSDPSAFDIEMHNQGAMLSSFYGKSPNDTWTLYLADLSPGGTAKLVSWSMDIKTTPEPSEINLLVAGLIVGAWFWRRLRSQNCA